MLVRDLIEELKKVNPNAQIFVAHDDEDGEDILSLEYDKSDISCFLIYKKED